MEEGKYTKNYEDKGNYEDVKKIETPVKVSLKTSREENQRRYKYIKVNNKE